MKKKNRPTDQGEGVHVGAELLRGLAIAARVLAVGLVAGLVLRAFALAAESWLRQLVGAKL